MYIDAHCHLDMPAFDEDRDAVIARARAAGVTQFLIAGVDPAGWIRQRALALQNWNPLWSAGVHPVRCAEMDEAELAHAMDALSRCFVGEGAACAVGETGLDRRFAPRSSLGVQITIFRRHLALAHELGMPVILHVVDAHGASLDVLRASEAPQRGGMVHSFSGSLEVANEYLSLGFYLSLSGAAVRAPSDRLRDVVRHIPEDRLMVETDAPDQSLVRGQRNEPGALLEIAERVGEIRGCTPQKILRDSAANCAELFGLRMTAKDG